jgi:glutaredoxin
MQIRLVINSLTVNRTEHEHSNRLLFLMEAKGIRDYELDDVNCGDHLGSVTKIRRLMHKAGKLHQTGPGETDVPQLWVNDVFVGGYHTVQALEDDGQLERILSGERCSHAYIHFLNGALKRSWHDYAYCPICDPNDDLVFYINSSYPKTPEWYGLFAELCH